MGINLCDINNWDTPDGPAKYLPNNYSANLDFTKYKFIEITQSVISQANGCFNKKSTDDDLEGVSSITANNLLIRGSIRVSSINCTNLTVFGSLSAQGPSSANININITSSSGQMSLIAGSVTPFTNFRITGVGNINVPSNNYISKIKQCVSTNFLDSNQRSKCIGSVTPKQDGGIVSLDNSFIGINISVNAGYVVFRNNSTNFGIINSFCELKDSLNRGKINDLCILDNSDNEGEIAGSLAIYQGGSSNQRITSAGKNIFSVGGNNIGTGIGDCYFVGGTNNGLCKGSCFLLGGSNDGIIMGDTMISGAGGNNGTISGNVNIYPGGSTNGLVIGSVNAVSGFVGGTIAGSLTAKACDGGGLYVSGQSSLVGCSITTLNNYGSINANVSSLNTVYCSGSFINCDETSNISNGYLSVDSARFRTSTNGADIEGDVAIFDSGSINTGRLIAGTNGVFTFSTNAGPIENGTATFNNSTNSASIFGATINFTKSTNNGSLISLSNVSFNSSINGGNVIVTGNNVVNFSDKSENYGEIIGNASFSNKSLNYGTIDGDATFDSTSMNYGSVIGECLGPGC